MSDDAYSYISRFIDLKKNEKELLLKHLQIMTCAPKQILTRAGEMEQHVYFIQKGIIRKYFYRNKEEVTIQISMEGDLVSSSVSFLSGVPSDFVLETMEPATLGFITRSSLETLYASSTNFERMGRLIILEWLLYKEKQDIERMVQTPKERFQMLMEERPSLINRVPQKYLASLLNIEPETFSRYKKQLMEEKDKIV